MTDKELGEMLVKLAGTVHKLNGVTSTGKEFIKEAPGHVLSIAAVKIAAQKAAIIEMKVLAHQQMLDAEIEMDRQKAIAYKKAMKESNATAAKDGKYDDEDFINARKDYATKKVQYERLKSITADAHDLIDAIKSRVIDLQGARKDERIS